MVGDYREKALRATQTARPEVDRTTGRFRLRGSKIDDGDARGASRINGDPQILFLIEGVGKGDHVKRVGPVARSPITSPRT